MMLDDRYILVHTLEVSVFEEAKKELGMWQLVTFLYSSLRLHVFHTQLLTKLPDERH